MGNTCLFRQERPAKQRRARRGDQQSQERGPRRGSMPQANDTQPGDHSHTDGQQVTEAEATASEGAQGAKEELKMLHDVNSPMRSDK